MAQRRTVRNKKGKYISYGMTLERRLGVIVLLLVTLWTFKDMNKEAEMSLKSAQANIVALQVQKSELEQQTATSSRTLEDVDIWKERIKNSKKVNLYDFFARYAPSSDNNNPVHYTNTVAKELDIDPNKPVVETLSSRIPEFAQAIANHEGFTSASSTIAVTHNNPGNLKYAGQKNATMGKSGFAKFKSLNDGWSALHRQIARDMSRSK